MVDLCHSNSLLCLNNGQCVVNISMNTTYCQCDSCYDGVTCQHRVPRQTRFDTTYVYLIVAITGLCFSILNNSLSLELFIGCRRIRRTNCGIYLIVYSILSLISSILFVVDQVVQYYPNQLFNNTEQYDIFHCYVSKIDYNTLVYLCIWFSSFVAFERASVIWRGRTAYASRWKPLITIIISFIIAGGSAAPMLAYKCGWDHIPGLQTARYFFVGFYISTGVVTYILATVTVLHSFTRRIQRYGVENRSFCKTFLKLLYTHLFIFAPPIAYAIGYIPYTIVYSTSNPDSLYFQCGISTPEFLVKVLLEALMGLPVIITWLLFVYPSKDYMTEFYLNTWSGKCLAKIVTFVEACCCRKMSVERWSVQA